MGRDIETIHAKGFDLSNNFCYNNDNEFGKVKTGLKTLTDATLNLGSLNKSLPGHVYASKSFIYSAMANNDIGEIRNISNFYYNINGIYKSVCNYAAYMYRYDWYVSTEKYGADFKMDKVKKDFNKVLAFLDHTNIRKMCGDIALEVVKNGAYYGYIVVTSDGLQLQQLPVSYCRSRFKAKGKDVIEFNMRFFDQFSDTMYRQKILSLFPPEFAKGYDAYRKGKIPADNMNTYSNSWYVLDVESTVKFNLNDNDLPLFINAIPSLIDLDMAQDLDRRKQMQKLLKILVQKLPRDKNGDLIFDVDEARDIHNNAVQMLKRAVGVDVLTTFADIDAVDTSDKNSSTTKDDLEKVERSVYNAFGISANLFNTEGNLALEKSVLNDESNLRNLLLQFTMFFDRVTRSLTNNKNYSFRLYMLETTQYNYKELSKMYKEQVQLGYSKLLPQIALGHSQSFILNSIEFENEMLNLTEIMIPPLMSSTMSSEDVLNKNKSSGETGRPEKAESEKSEKTIQNQESMS